jgi:hypothetical protein
MVWLYKLPYSCIALLFGAIGAASAKTFSNGVPGSLNFFPYLFIATVLFSSPHPRYALG